MANIMRFITHPFERRTESPRRPYHQQPIFPYEIFDAECLDESYDPESQRTKAVHVYKYLSTGTKEGEIQGPHEVVFPPYLEGFDHDDRHWSNKLGPGATMEGFESHVQPSEDNPEEWYDIGLAFTDLHAMVIIRESENQENDDAKAYIDHINEYEKNFPLEGPSLRVVHIRFTRRPNPLTPIELSFGEPGVLKITAERYHELYRIRTTMRMLKHIALTACPEKHTLIDSDCATFAHNFLWAQLDHLLEQNRMKPDLHRMLLGSIVRNNHTTDVIATRETETVVRGDPRLAGTGGASAKAYVDTSGTSGTV